MAYLASLALLAGLAPAARAELRFKETTVNLGEVRSGVRLGQEFSFVNAGTEAAEIVEVRPGCGCLRPRLARRVFQAGEAGTIPLEVNALGQSAGPHTWRMQLVYRSGQQTHETTLQVTAQVITEVTLQPAALTLFAEGALSQDILLTDLRPQPLTVTELATSSPHLRARVVEQQRDGLNHLIYRIRLEVGAGCAEGRHGEALAIYTSDPVYRELQVPITVVKRPRSRVTTTPAEVALELAPGQAVASRMLRVSDRQGEAVAIDEVTADDPAISCTFAPGPDNLATVRVQVDGGRIAGEVLRSAIHITLRRPVAQTVTVPLSVTRGN